MMQVVPKQGFKQMGFPPHKLIDASCRPALQSGIKGRCVCLGDVPCTRSRHMQMPADPNVFARGCCPPPPLWPLEPPADSSVQSIRGKTNTALYVQCLFFIFLNFSSRLWMFVFRTHNKNFTGFFIFKPTYPSTFNMRGAPFLQLRIPISAPVGKRTQGLYSKPERYDQAQGIKV